VPLHHVPDLVAQDHQFVLAVDGVPADGDDVHVGHVQPQATDAVERKVLTFEDHRTSAHCAEYPAQGGEDPVIVTGRHLRHAGDQLGAQRFHSALCLPRQHRELPLLASARPPGLDLALHGPVQGVAVDRLSLLVFAAVFTQ
jgi:hypothetical protein